MPVNIYGPPEIVFPKGKNIFLAGPIQGAPDWQAETEANISNTESENSTIINVFNPRAQDINSHTKKEQIEWEKRSLEQARDNGALLFWFAAQDHSLSYPEGRSYAQTSRIEFGRVLGWQDYDSRVSIALGIEPGYEGGNEDYIRSCALENGILPVFQNLGSLATHAVRLAKT